MSRKRVVLVCMVDSIHVARWIAQFDASEVEFTLFPSTPNRRVHAMIRDIMSKNGNIKIVPFGGNLSIPLWGIDLIFSDYVRGLLLRRVLKQEQPDFVHALELQHGGYIASRALEDASIKTPFIATNYGSDIYWFQQFPKHLDKIKKVLARADRYSAECNRDVELAKKYGFTGEVMPVFPNAGGFTEEQLNRPLTLTADRKVIAIKGYEGWVGRASVAIEALYSLIKELADFKIVFYSCNAKTIRLVKKLKRKTGLNIEWHGKGELAHTEMLDLFASAKIYIGISLSDGISTSLLEAMAMGAYPIQTRTACVEDWFEDKVSGTYLEGVSASEVQMAVRSTYGNESSLDYAQKENLGTVRSRLAPSASSVPIEFYGKGRFQARNL
jgi:glycosyltransferase involved in cell wall biosynthesis